MKEDVGIFYSFEDESVVLQEIKTFARDELRENQ